MSGLTRSAAEELLYREARALDERRFDDWLAMYAPDVVFWMPAWKDETTPTSDPNTRMSVQEMWLAATSSGRLSDNAPVAWTRIPSPLSKARCHIFRMIVSRQSPVFMAMTCKGARISVLAKMKARARKILILTIIIRFRYRRSRRMTSAPLGPCSLDR